MAAKPMTYAETGVDIDANDRMVELIRHHMARTRTQRVLGGHGDFAGCFRLDYNEKLFQRNYRDPVLVSCTDSVGSKVKLAVELDICNTVGRDAVAMCVNDLIVKGAEPLFFLDYIGTHKLDPERMTEIVDGVADGCQLAGCALLGGETAELPDLYAPGDFDLAGFAVGVCDRRKLVDRMRLERGDVIFGLASSGIHSNGYALVRKIVKGKDLDLHKPAKEVDAQRTLGEVLLTPTRIYAKSVVAVLNHYRVKRVVSAMAHITGGGLGDNIGRVLPPDLDARIDRKTWPILPVFELLQKHGRVEDEEMWRVFNMGIGYCVIVRPDFANSIANQLKRRGETVYCLGKIVKGNGRVQMV